jgi:hypothetical protein
VHHDPNPAVVNPTQNFPNQYYDSLTISRRGGSTTTYNLGLSFPAGPTPTPYPGWSDNMGVQFQMDIGSKGTSMAEWVDEVDLTAH